MLDQKHGRVTFEREWRASTRQKKSWKRSFEFPGTAKLQRLGGKIPKVPCEGPPGTGKNTCWPRAIAGEAGRCCPSSPSLF